MLHDEFIKLSGLRVSGKCYKEHIEPQYDASDLPKDQWVKQWKKFDGIDKAYQYEFALRCVAEEDAKKAQDELHNYMKKTISKVEKYDNLKADYDDQVRENKKLRDMYQNSLEVRQAYIDKVCSIAFDQNFNIDNDTITNIVISIVGHGALVRHKLNNGYELNEDDRKYILDKMSKSI